MICKGPNESYSYTVEWVNEIGADTISTSSWVVEAGITNDGDSHDSGTTTTIDLSGGTAGTTYTLTNQITTAGGDIWEKDLFIKVQNQILG
jgi:hypothetical protein